MGNDSCSPLKMKVTKENNRLMIIANILTIILTILLVLIRVSETRLDAKSGFVMRVAIEAGYILTLLYLVNILQFFDEKTAFRTPFELYIGFEVIKFILSMLKFSDLSSSQTYIYVMGIGLLNFCISLYLIISLFKIKHPVLAQPYRLFGISLILILLTKFGLPLIFMNLHILPPSAYFGVIDCIPLLAIFYIIRKTGTLLDTIPK